MLIFQRCLVFIPGQRVLSACAAILKINVCMTPEPSHFLAKCLSPPLHPQLGPVPMTTKDFSSAPFSLCVLLTVKKSLRVKAFNKLTLLRGTVTEISAWFPLCEWGLNGAVKPDVGLSLQAQGLGLGLGLGPGLCHTVCEFSCGLAARSKWAMAHRNTFPIYYH